MVSYNFTVNIISKICQQNTAYGHNNTQDDDIRRLLEGKLRVTVAKGPLCVTLSGWLQKGHRSAEDM